MVADAEGGAIPRIAEWAFAALATVLVVSLHVAFWRHAGPLWRDEINSIQVAGTGSVGQMWHDLRYDSFPALFFVLVRLWLSAGWTSTDLGIRVFGLLVGLGLLAALWVNARQLGHSMPFASLVLFAMNPWVVRSGDSIRGYGLGMLLLVLSVGLIWRVTESPTPRRVVCAASSAVLCVHVLYSAAFLLGAICLAAIVVGLRKRAWSSVVAVAGIGGATASSLLIYWETVAQAQAWNVLLQVPFSFRWYWELLSNALAAPYEWVVYAWLGLFGATVVAGCMAQWTRLGTELTERQREIVWFCTLTEGGAVVSFVIFLGVIRFGTQPWYYLPLMAVVAVSADGVLCTVVAGLPGRVLRLGGVVLLAALMFPGTWQRMRTRQTNMDLVAAKLQSLADQRDLIVVSPWYYAVAFQRYYSGSTPWTSVPPLVDHRIHRYDLVKKQMSTANAIRPVVDWMAETLKSGQRIWVVGAFSFAPAGMLPPEIPPAPHPEWGWSDSLYTRAWLSQAETFIQQHATAVGQVPIVSPGPVNEYENLPMILVVQGWR